MYTLILTIFIICIILSKRRWPDIVSKLFNRFFLGFLLIFSLAILLIYEISFGIDSSNTHDFELWESVAVYFNNMLQPILLAASIFLLYKTWRTSETELKETREVLKSQTKAQYTQHNFEIFSHRLEKFKEVGNTNLSTFHYKNVFYELVGELTNTSHPRFSKIHNYANETLKSDRSSQETVSKALKFLGVENEFYDNADDEQTTILLHLSYIIYNSKKTPLELIHGGAVDSVNDVNIQVEAETFIPYKHYVNCALLADFAKHYSQSPHEAEFMVRFRKLLTHIMEIKCDVTRKLLSEELLCTISYRRLEQSLSVVPDLFEDDLLSFIRSELRERSTM
ncbi:MULTISPECIES: hypothetical protein [Pseudoalteromonas]|uniref:Phage abortive infection protein n=1 Tax=Pseudoalteromonas amylolytica TaxID=1859457 RepID=A0A1S1MXJ7_9GAMM|nr:MULTISPECIES: hypothetical protein [Pseudoalteromonas]OHU85531.1 hypothetical protein BFC16_19475 [Pseudoalteromonas sp. JW3]OHU91765.1 hypothetical protein BET10_08170 [Pseudoalteromonas amylolytica]